MNTAVKLKLLLNTALLLVSFRCLGLDEKISDLIGRGKEAFHSGKQDKSLTYFNQAINRAAEEGSELAETYYLVARFYADESIDELALKYYFIALDESEKNDNDQLTQEIYNYIGGSYFNRLYYLQAKKYWEKSKDINARISNKKGLSSNLNNLGEIERLSSDEKAALDLFLQARVLKEEVHDSLGLCTVLTNIALSYINLDKADSGKVLLDKSYQMADALGSTHLKEYVGQAYSKYYAVKGDVEQSLHWLYYVLSQDRLKANPDFGIRKNVYNELFSFHKKNNNLDSSLIYQIKLNELETDLLRKEKDIQETESKIELLLVNKNKEIDDLRNMSVQNQLIAYGAIALTLLIIIFIILYLWQRGKAIAQKAISIQHEKELIEMKSRFISAASHQFRTPLAAIQTSIASLMMRKKEMNEDVQMSLEKVELRVKQNIEKMTTLMDNILLYNSIDEGTLNLKNSDHEISAFIDSVVRRFKEEYPEREIEFRKLSGACNLSLNYKLLEQVINNLLKNALIFSKEHEAVIVKIEKQEDSITISIIDHGIGIPEKDMLHIFEPFYRGSNAMEIPGSGMGLAIVKECSFLLQVKVEVESEIGQGTKVLIRLEQ